MRGKQPKEREKYVIRLGDGTLVEVNREIYLEWYQSERRERYQKERDRKYGVYSLEGLIEKGYIPEMTVDLGNVTEEIVLRNIDRNKLWDAFSKLPEQDIWLIWLLYFEEITVKEAMGIFGCSRKSIGNCRRRILMNLRWMMEKKEML